MRATRVLLNAAKNKKSNFNIPVELYPLFAATGVAIISGFVFTYRHFAYDRQLRLWQNPDLSELDKVLDAHNKKDEKK